MKKHFLTTLVLAGIISAPLYAAPDQFSSDAPEMSQKQASHPTKAVQEEAMPSLPNRALSYTYNYLKNWPTNAYNNTKKIISFTRQHLPAIGVLGTVVGTLYLKTSFAQAMPVFSNSYYQSDNSTADFRDCMSVLPTHQNSTCFQDFGSASRGCTVMNWWNHRNGASFSFDNPQDTRISLRLCENIFSVMDPVTRESVINGRPELLLEYIAQCRRYVPMSGNRGWVDTYFERNTEHACQELPMMYKGGPVPSADNFPYWEGQTNELVNFINRP